MIEIKKPMIECLERNEDGSYGKFVVEPLERGYGITLGNSLRRVLLSSLPGAAVTAIRVDGVFHEFSTVKGVIEDMTEIILNVKGIRASLNVEGPKTVYISTEEGRTGVVTAEDIVRDDEVEIMNTEHPIATLNGDGRLFMELTLTKGRGYNTADRNKWANQTIGVIPIDSIFTPVRKVNFSVENTRVGQFTDYDKLTLEIWTDATIDVAESLSQGADSLRAPEPVHGVDGHRRRPQFQGPGRRRQQKPHSGHGDRGPRFLSPDLQLPQACRHQLNRRPGRPF